MMNILRLKFERFMRVFKRLKKKQWKLSKMRIAPAHCTYTTANPSDSAKFPLFFAYFFLFSKHSTALYVTRKYANSSILVTFKMMFFLSRQENIVVISCVFRNLTSCEISLFSVFLRSHFHLAPLEFHMGNRSANKTMLKCGTLFLFIIRICYFA